MQNTLLVKIEQSIVTLTLNRPEVHNAFDDELIHSLTAELKRINDDKRVRVAILKANGKSFSAGADLNWMQRMINYSEEQNYVDSLALAELMKTLYYLQKPTIAVIQGAAFGGGVGLVACCDVAIASVKASFCLSEVKLGLIPAIISPYVIEAIGERAAKRYFLTAERFDANEAHRLGLVHNVVEQEMLDKTISELIQHLLQNSPQAVCEAKRLINDVSKQSIDDSLINDTAKRIASIRVSAEGQEGLQAFLKKRQPQW